MRRKVAGMNARGLPERPPSEVYKYSNNVERESGASAAITAFLSSLFMTRSVVWSVGRPSFGITIMTAVGSRSSKREKKRMDYPIWHVIFSFRTETEGGIICIIA